MATTYLIDSNILIYASNEDSEYQPQALEVMHKVLAREIQACTAYQSLYEFYAVITNPKRVEKPISLQQARETIERYMRARNIRKIYPVKTNLKNVLKLLKKYEVSKQNIFDLVLVATMMDNKVTGIYTRNEAHFNQFDFLEVVNPF